MHQKASLCVLASTRGVFCLEVLANLNGSCELLVCVHILNTPARVKSQLPLSCQMVREKMISTQQSIDCSTSFGGLIFPFPLACHTSLILPEDPSMRNCIPGLSVLSYWHLNDDNHLACGHRFWMSALWIHRYSESRLIFDSEFWHTAMCVFPIWS